MKTLKWAILVLSGLVAMPRVVTAADSPNVALARQLNQAFIEVAERVSPAVVVITVHQKPSTNDDEGSSPLDSLAPELRRYFRERQLEIPAQGSGVIIRDDGYILTNGHVVEDADKIEVRLHDGRMFTGKVRGVDQKSDVAVVKIEARDLPTAALADSTKTRVGEFAIAIGAPFSLDYTVTFGHVSAKSRSDIVTEAGSGLVDQDFIQTDALINPGNSGGPLVNIDGDVIGINTLIRGMHTGIGFAIPSSLAREVSDQLVKEGKFTRAMLGVEIHPFREDLEAHDWVKDLKDGVIVKRIISGGPAAKSELATNDIITAVDGKQVATVQELRGEIRSKKLGEPVMLDVVRPASHGEPKRMTIEIKPAEWADPPPPPVMARARPVPAPVAPEKDAPSIGVTVHNLTHELADHYKVDVTTDGVVVVGVEKGSAAARKGIKPGDVISNINKQPVSSRKDFQEALRQADLKAGITVRVVSGKKTRSEVLKDED
jgi:serine protease Do